MSTTEPTPASGLTEEEWEVMRHGFAPYSVEPDEWVRIIAPAVERVIAARLAERDARVLRDTAEKWRTTEPQASTYAHARFFARELDNEADTYERQGGDNG